MSKNRLYLVSLFVGLCLFSYWGLDRTGLLPGRDEVHSEVVMIPMRDGALLPADVYRLAHTKQKLPCILVRTPAGRKTYANEFTHYVKDGYVVVIQDSRSYLDKEGKTFPYITDVNDGYDTVEWLAKSQYTNGKIGTVGFSAMGITQLFMATGAPPSLKCQYIGFAVPNLYDSAIYMGGQLRKAQVEGWLGYYANHPSVMSLVKSLNGQSPFWQRLNCLNGCSRVTVPAVHYGGWHDTFSQGTLDSYVYLQERGDEGAKGKQKLIMGPWTHHWPRDRGFGDFDLHLESDNVPAALKPDAWFAAHLKGDASAVDKLPAVTYFVMGTVDGTDSSGNVWKSAEHWPPPATATKMYLSAEHSLQESSEAKGVEMFTYDPDKPTPTVGGRNLFLATGPMDQQKIEERDDIVVFTSQPLASDVEVTGRIKALIYFATDCDDTDVAVRLTDVYPDGKSVLVVDGIRKLSTLPNSHRKNSPNPVEVDLWSTSQVFAKGHRIRVSVASSNYPRFEKNLNSLNEDARVANNKIYFGGSCPSHIVLPIVETF